MKKLFILILMVLVGIGLALSNSRADSTRTIKMKTGVALSTNTVIVANGGTLYKVMGTAASSNASYIVYDVATVAAATIGGASVTQSNILTEGGEATQYDSLPSIDFGSEGMPFTTGLVVVTSTADVVLHYR